ncbi:MAG TPA: hypothetical protein ENN97_03545 [Phycisphaerales bacterium]|nr:hypothetical protein [Phycisphaerales bacterium]
MKNKILLATLLVCLCAGGLQASPIPVTNYSFEEPGVGKIKGWDGEGVDGTPAVDIPGWTSDSTPTDSGVETGFGATDGEYNAFLRSTDPAVWQVTEATVTPGVTYVLTADLWSTWQGEFVEMVLFYQDDGTRIALASVEVPVTGDPATATLVFSADDAPAEAAGKPIGILFDNTTTAYGDSSWTGIDYVRLSAQYVTLINPAPDGIEFVPTETSLEWLAVGGWPVDVYLSGPYTEPNEAPILNQIIFNEAATGYTPEEGFEIGGKWYYWRVDVYEPNEVGEQIPVLHPGPVWHFRTVERIPRITQQPVNALVEAGQTALFEVVASSLTEEEYQWYRSDDAIIDEETDEALAGRQSPVLEIADTQIADEGYYYCRIENTAGAVYTQVVTLAVRRTMAHWTLDEADYADGRYLDVSGEGRHADPNGTPTFDEGVLGEGALIYGDGWADAGTWDPSQYSGQLTLSLWAKWDGVSGWQGLIAKRNAFEVEEMLWLLEIASGSNAVEFKSTTQTVGSPAIPADQWEHVAVTFDGQTAIIYRNGVQAAQGTVVFGQKTDANMVIGAAELNEQTGAAWTFNGALDDVRIYNYVLDFEAVAELYYAATGDSPCVYSYADHLDFNADCVVDLLDFAEMASQWLDTGRYPR